MLFRKRFETHLNLTVNPYNRNTLEKALSKNAHRNKRSSNAWKKKKRKSTQIPPRTKQGSSAPKKQTTFLKIRVLAVLV